MCENAHIQTVATDFEEGENKNFPSRGMIKRQEEPKKGKRNYYTMCKILEVIYSQLLPFSDAAGALGSAIGIGEITVHC